MPLILRVSCATAGVLALVAVALGLTAFAGLLTWRAAATSSNMGVIFTIGGIILAMSAVQVRRGYNWGALVPIAALVALAATWVHAGGNGFAILAVLVLAGILALVWVAPPEVRAFYTAMDDHRAALTEEPVLIIDDVDDSPE